MRAAVAHSYGHSRRGSRPSSTTVAIRRSLVAWGAFPARLSGSGLCYWRHCLKPTASKFFFKKSNQTATGRCGSMLGAAGVGADPARSQRPYTAPLAHWGPLRRAWEAMGSPGGAAAPHKEQFFFFNGMPFNGPVGGARPFFFVEMWPMP